MKSVLFLNFNKIGDTLLQTQLFHGLKAAKPDVTIHVLCSPAAFEVLRNNPHLDSVEISYLIPERSIRSFLAYRRQCLGIIKKHSVDTIVCDTVNSTPVTALLMQWLPVKERIYAAPIRKPWYRWLVKNLTHLNADAGRYTSIVQQNRAILRYLGVSAEGKVKLFPTPAEEAAARRVLEKIRAASEGRKLISVALFSAQPATSWPLSHVVSFLEEASRKYQVLLLGSPGDLTKLPATILRNPAVFAPSLSLRESFCAVKGSDLFISLDSGPSHFFESLDIPMLRLNSARIPAEQWGYEGAPGYHALQVPVPCGPCHSRYCAVEGHPCMRDLTPAMVLARVQQILVS